MTALTDEELLARFEDATLDAGAFGHQEHVRVAWLFVCRDGMPAALSTFSAALRNFAAAKGVPNLFHATITWAYLLLLHERVQRGDTGTWPEFSAANADLLVWRPSILDRYYTADALWSGFARHTFVMPDRGTTACVHDSTSNRLKVECS